MLTSRTQTRGFRLFKLLLYLVFMYMWIRKVFSLAFKAAVILHWEFSTHNLCSTFIAFFEPIWTLLVWKVLWINKYQNSAGSSSPKKVFGRIGLQIPSLMLLHIPLFYSYTFGEMQIVCGSGFIQRCNQRRFLIMILELRDKMAKASKASI